VKGWFLQGLKKDIGHIRRHPVCGRQDADPALPFIGPVGKIPLHLSHLIDLERLPFGFQDQHIGVKPIVYLFTGNASVAGICFIGLPLKAVQGFGKLESQPFLSDPLASEKEVTVDDPVIQDGPLKQFNGSIMTNDIFERHNLNN